MHALSPQLEIEVLPVTAFQQNCSLLRCTATNKGALVDPGGEPARLLAAVEASGDELEKILLTHGHIDHAGATAELAERLGLPIE
jgi:glyoxylase-like metal-dependent hydrolase (beta-lactamase superfamily II)